MFWNRLEFSACVQKQSGNCCCDHFPFFRTSKLISISFDVHLENLQRSAVQLSERLASLGIIAGVHLKPLEHHSPIITWGLRGDLTWFPIMPRDASASRTADVNSSSIYLFFFFMRKYLAVSETIRKKCFL